MPTNRKRISRSKIPDISPTEWACLNDEPMPEGYNRWEQFILARPQLRDEVCRDLWSHYREIVLAEWCRSKPGARPSYWWVFDAPRLPEDQHGDYAGSYLAKWLIAPRLRLGGKGTPKHEVLCYAPSFGYGIPERWVDDWEIEYYNGRAVDVYDAPIGQNYSEGDFVAQHFDPNDPPRYESQAAYLKRHGLLMPGEARRIKPSQFLPGLLPKAYWPNRSVDDVQDISKT